MKVWVRGQAFYHYEHDGRRMRRMHAIGWELITAEVDGFDEEGEKVMNDGLDVKLVGRVQELRYDLEHLNDRTQARALKVQLVALHEASSRPTVSADAGHIVDQFFEEARAKILKDFGTAAWDEPETLEEARARMGTLPQAPAPGVLDRIGSKSGMTPWRSGIAFSEPPPLTDEELTNIEALTEQDFNCQECGLRTADRIRLVAEVRRLRGQLPAAPGADVPDRVRRIDQIAQFIERGIAPPFEEVQELAVEVRKLRLLYTVADTQLRAFRSGVTVDEMAQTIADLTADNERLRSDEWLKKAAEEIAADRAGYASSSGPVTELRLLQALRRHRDGKA